MKLQDRSQQPFNSRKQSTSFSSASTVLLESCEEQQDSLIVPQASKLLCLGLEENEDTPATHFKLPTFSSQVAYLSTKAASTMSNHFNQRFHQLSPSMRKQQQQLQLPSKKQLKIPDFSSKSHEELVQTIIELLQEKESQKDELETLQKEESNQQESSMTRQRKLQDTDSIISQLRVDKERLVDMNQRSMKSNDTLHRENKQLKQNHEQLKQLYKQLRIDFQTAIHKQQELYLQLNSEKSKGILNGNSNCPIQQNRPFNVDGVSASIDVNDENVNASNITCSSSSQSQGKKQTTHKNGLDSRISSSNQCSSMKKQPEQHFIQSSSILMRLCSIYGVTNEEELIACANKTKVVVEAVPRLEAIIEEISHVLFIETQQPLQSQQQVGFGQKPTFGVEDILPRIRSWAEEIKCVDRFLEFKDEVCVLLEIPKATSSDRDIITALESLQSLRINRGSLIVPSFGSTIPITTQPVSVAVIETLQTLGVSINMENAVAKLQSISVLQNDLKRFLKVARAVLKMRADTPHDVTFTSVLQLLERMN